MGGYRYKMNMTTGRLDMVRGLSGAGTTPTSQKSVEATLYNGECPVVHSVGAAWQSAEVLTVDVTDIIILANALKVAFNGHIASFGAGATHVNADGVNPVTAANATDWTTACQLAFDLMIQYTDHNTDAELGAAWLYHQAQNGATHVLSFGTINYTADGMLAALNEIKLKFNTHDTDSTSHVTKDLFQVATADATYVWKDSAYLPRVDSSNPLNAALIDSVVDDYALITFYFG
jgi:hypothetical protein